MPKLPAHYKIKLEEALEKLEDLSNPKSKGCALDPEIKEAVRSYVKTWVEMPLKQIAEWDAGLRDGRGKPNSKYYEEGHD